MKWYVRGKYELRTRHHRDYFAVQTASWERSSKWMPIAFLSLIKIGSC